MSITLPGWTCPVCRCFCGEEKIALTECRSCGYTPWAPSGIGRLAPPPPSAEHGWRCHVCGCWMHFRQCLGCMTEQMPNALEVFSGLPWHRHGGPFPNE
jgi:hypothetical protein